MERPDADSAPARSSPLARWTCAAWVAMIVYASLTPWSDWLDRGVRPWAYLTAPWPRHLPTFDLLVNVVGYLPLGATLVLALYPRLRGAAAVIGATAIGALLSGWIEAIQTYLPARVASNVDLATNSLGTLLGAVLLSHFAPAIIDRGRLLQARRRWFRLDETAGLVLAGLWPIAQAYPTSSLFGIGRWNALSDGMVQAAAWIGVDPEWLSAPLRDGSDFVLAEAAIATAGLLAAGLGLACALQRHAPRVALLVGWVGAALLVKTLAGGVAFGADDLFAWATRGALAGLTLGGFTLLAASTAPARILPRLAVISTLVLLLLVNLLPENPYHEAWVQQWRPGQLRNLAAAAHWLGTAWPLAWLTWATTRLRDRGRPVRAAAAPAKRDPKPGP